MEINFKNITIRRYPYHPKDQLFAFDSSDELVVDFVLAENVKNVLVIEDRFGAITLGLNKLDCLFLNDSYVSLRGLQENAKLNNLKLAPSFRQLDEISNLEEVDLVILKMPKNLSYFEDLIQALSEKLSPNTIIVCPVMIKHLSKTSFEILEKYFGKTWTSLATKKARLIFSKLEKKQKSSFEKFEVTVPGFDHTFSNYSNVFCGTKLDIGTRFLLDHIPENSGKVLDLGCGSGILGIAHKLKNPSSHITFADESWMAIKSTNANYKKYFSDEATFHWVNCFEENDLSNTDEYDLILCNPPFHQQNVVGDFIARAMFKDSSRVLKNGGVLRVVGNRHLNYHVILKKYFKNVQIISSNNKFVIIDAIK